MQRRAYDYGAAAPVPKKNGAALNTGDTPDVYCHDMEQWPACPPAAMRFNGAKL